MWQKQTPEELAQSRTKKSLVDFLTGFGLIGIVGVLTLFGLRRAEAPAAQFTIPDLPAYLICLVVAIVAGVAWAAVNSGRDGTQICPQCEKTKVPDGDSSCPCGGTFERLSEMKWVKDEADNGEDNEENG